ncbi:MAG: hypothetical protein HOP16_07545 [Acidobacteria bacterium]|nr:hypothetical protein [Acidobacteriota bacterium]
MLRTRRSAIVLCVVVVVCVALVPAPYLSTAAILVPLEGLFSFVHEGTSLRYEQQPLPSSSDVSPLLAPRAPPV